MEMKPDPDAEDMIGGGEGSGSRLGSELKISELERKLREVREEKESLDLLRFHASQELDKKSRECVSLAEKFARLEEDFSTLRAREKRDLDRINGLLEEIEKKDADHKRSFVELKDHNRELELTKDRAAKEAQELRKRNEDLRAKVARTDLRSVTSSEAHELRKRNAELAGEFDRKEREVKQTLLRLTEEHRDHEREHQRREREYEERIELLKLENENLSVDLRACNLKCKELQDENYRISEKLKAATEDLGRKNMPTELDREQPNGSAGPVKVSCGAKRKHVFTAGTDTESEAEAIQSSLKRNSRITNSQAGIGKLTSTETATTRAMRLMSNLDANNPSFLKSMIPTNVYPHFMLAIPANFCRKHFPGHNIEITLEDENGIRWEIKYIKSGLLSGGWRSFAMEHNLEVGDVLVFELYAPRKFKVYIIKANDERSSKNLDAEIAEDNVSIPPTGANA